MKPWNSRSLDEVLLDNRAGYWGDGEPTSKRPEEVRVVRNGDINATEGLVGSATRYFSTSEAAKACLRIGDVAMTTSGDIGKLWEVDRKGYCATNFVRILRPDPAALAPGYLPLVLQSEAGQQALRQCTAGTTIPNLRKSFFKQLQVPLPPLAEQKRIVAIVDEAFEAIATAAASTERNLDNAGILLESESQLIFRGGEKVWERVRLSVLISRGCILDHMDGNHGSDYPRKHEFLDKGIPYITASCIRDGRVDLDLGKHLTPERAALLRKGFAKPGDVLFAHNASVGSVAVLGDRAEAVILGTSLTYYRCNKNQIVPEFLAHYMRSPGFSLQYERVMRQSTRNQVPITKQRELYFVVPPIEEQRAVARHLDRLTKQTGCLAAMYSSKLTRLVELKQSLLAKAFVGELTAKVADKTVALA